MPSQLYVIILSVFDDRQELGDILTEMSQFTHHAAADMGEFGGSQKKDGFHTAELPVDITHIPFSRYGAYLAVTRDEGKNGTGDAKELVIQCARRRFEESPLFSLTFGGEAPEDFTCSAVPELLTVGNENGKLQK